MKSIHIKAFLAMFWPRLCLTILLCFARFYIFMLDSERVLIIVKCISYLHCYRILWHSNLLTTFANNNNSGFQWRFNALILCFCTTLFQTTHQTNSHSQLFILLVFSPLVLYTLGHLKKSIIIIIIIIIMMMMMN